MTMLVISNSKIILELWSRDIYLYIINFTTGTFFLLSLLTEPPSQLLTQTQAMLTPYSVPNLCMNICLSIVSCVLFLFYKASLSNKIN